MPGGTGSGAPAVGTSRPWRNDAVTGIGEEIVVDAAGVTGCSRYAPVSARPTPGGG